MGTVSCATCGGVIERPQKLIRRNRSGRFYCSVRHREADPVYQEKRNRRALEGQKHYFSELRATRMEAAGGCGSPTCQDPDCDVAAGSCHFHGCEHPATIAPHTNRGVRWVRDQSTLFCSDKRHSTRTVQARTRQMIAELEQDGELSVKAIARRLAVHPTAIDHYLERGHLSVSRELPLPGMRPLRLVLVDEVERFEKEWTQESNGRRLRWLDPERYISQYRNAGHLARLAERKQLSEAAAEAVIRSQIKERRKALLRHRRGRKPRVGPPAPPPDYHLTWAAAFAGLKEELNRDYEERLDLDVLAPGEKPPTNKDIALAVADQDAEDHPERWDYSPANPDYAKSAADRVWKAIKALQIPATGN